MHAFSHAFYVDNDNDVTTSKYVNEACQLNVYDHHNVPPIYADTTLRKSPYRLTAWLDRAAFVMPPGNASDILCRNNTDSVSPWAGTGLCTQRTHPCASRSLRDGLWVDGEQVTKGATLDATQDGNYVGDDKAAVLSASKRTIHGVEYSGLGVWPPTATTTCSAVGGSDANVLKIGCLRLARHDLNKAVEASDYYKGLQSKLSWPTDTAQHLETAEFCTHFCQTDSTAPHALTGKSRFDATTGGMVSDWLRCDPTDINSPGHFCDAFMQQFCGPDGPGRDMRMCNCMRKNPLTNAVKGGDSGSVLYTTDDNSDDSLITDKVQYALA